MHTYACDEDGKPSNNVLTTFTDAANAPVQSSSVVGGVHGSCGDVRSFCGDVRSFCGDVRKFFGEVRRSAEFLRRSAEILLRCAEFFQVCVGFIFGLSVTGPRLGENLYRENHSD
jgi:hypothetical protein